jgi:hypothetical protein
MGLLAAPALSLEAARVVFCVVADVVEKGYLPADRADGCDGEYEQISYAFKSLIDPHLDMALARKVLKRWMREVDAPPRRPPNR